MSAADSTELGERAPRAWCVNFDGNTDVLSYGLRNNLWMMQYQYPHNGQVFQGRNQTGATTKNWRQAGRVMAGDFLLAYVPSNRFFAVGKVRAPRKAASEEDSVERVVAAQTHDRTSDVVRYTDVFYEDFTDSFERRVQSQHTGQVEVWRYNQRIDVEAWKHVVEEGVEVKGMGSLQPRPQYRTAVFEIPISFLDSVVDELSENSGEPRFQLEATLNSLASEVEDAGYFDPDGIEDARDRQWREIVQRRGQAEFRRTLLDAYGDHCAITGCDAVPALEAAHIVPYLGPETNHVTNGLLLRADVHTLFDLNLIGIHPDSRRIIVSDQLQSTSYREELGGRILNVPGDATKQPNQSAMQRRWSVFNDPLQ